MKLITKLLAVVCLIALFNGPAANAQKGSFKFPSTPKAKGAQADTQSNITSYEVYLLGPGTTVNGSQNSYISCDNYDGVTVGSDDNETTCYAMTTGNGFNLTGLYYNMGDGTGCTTGAAQPVYIEVRKGIVGQTSSPTLALIDVPPSAWNCDYLYNNSSTVFFNVSEFTNAAAAFVLGPFANWKNPTGTDGITTTSDTISSASTTASITALALGFDTIQNYVTASNGYYGGSDSNLSTQFNTIADVIDECLDMSGSGAASCSNLFSDTKDNAFTGTYTPQDTWQALASLAQDPKHDVANELTNINANAAWNPYDSSAPSSWTIYTSGAPVITSVSGLANGVSSSNSGKKSTFVTIAGSNLTTGTTCPTVVVGFQALNPNATGNVCNSSSLYMQLPLTPAQSSLAVYFNGLVSNQMPFTITIK